MINGFSALNESFDVALYERMCCRTDIRHPNWNTNCDIYIDEKKEVWSIAGCFNAQMYFQLIFRFIDSGSLSGCWNRQGMWGSNVMYDDVVILLFHTIGLNPFNARVHRPWNWPGFSFLLKHCSGGCFLNNLGLYLSANAVTEPCTCNVWNMRKLSKSYSAKI